jgi:hypothetical protein
VVDVTKRYLIAVAAHNLGRILRKLFGIGKPKALQGGYAEGGHRALAQLPRLLAMRWFSAIGIVRNFLLALFTPSPRLRAAGIKRP